MIKLLLLLMAFFISCGDNSSVNEKSVSATTIKTIQINDQGQTEKVLININASKVAWKGTKLMGTGSHSGTVSFKDGYLLFSGNELTGGELTVDMSSIYITDIPLSDPIPRKNITTHLNIDFETDVFPTSVFRITSVSRKPDYYAIEGELKIKGITRPISIKAREVKRKVYYISEFTFDRFDWKIGENGSWLEKKLVDSDISLKVTINTQ